MNISPRSIKMLTLDSGRCPFEAWYRSLRDVATRARIRARLTRLEDGNFGDWRSVGEGVAELRLDFGAGYRIYYALYGDALVVLLAGGDKSTQTQDIANAQSLWKAYQNAPEGFQRDFS